MMVFCFVKIFSEKNGKRTVMRIVAFCPEKFSLALDELLKNQTKWVSDRARLSLV